MPRGFEIFGLPADVYTPYPTCRRRRRFRGRSLIGIGRTEGRCHARPGAGRNGRRHGRAGALEQPDFNTGWTVNVVPLREQLVGDVRLAVLVLFGAVGAVLLIACGNIGSLMLTRASGRRRELAIRSAIGAGTGRLLTQLVCESLMLSIVGGALAEWSSRPGSRAG